MMNWDRKKFFYSNRKMLELLSNTNGNADGNWVDTSMYAKDAIQTGTTITPNYTTDLFGTGVNGFKFGANDLFSMPMHDGLILGDGDGSQAFTVEMTVRFTTSTTASRQLISKFRNVDGYADWQCILYTGNQIRFIIYSEGNPAAYIRCTYFITPTVNQVYNFKFVYTGEKTGASCLFYLDGVRCVSSQNNVGTFVRVGNTPESIKIGRYMYLPVEDVTNVKYTKGIV